MARRNPATTNAEPVVELLLLRLLECVEALAVVVGFDLAAGKAFGKYLP